MYLFNVLSCSFDCIKGKIKQNWISIMLTDQKSVMEHSKHILVMDNVAMQIKLPCRSLIFEGKFLNLNTKDSTFLQELRWLNIKIIFVCVNRLSSLPLSWRGNWFRYGYPVDFKDQRRIP